MDNKKYLVVLIALLASLTVLGLGPTKVEALTTGANDGIVLGATTVDCAFARNLYLGVSGPDAQCLQQFLNSAGFLLAGGGPGSPGSETTYFGPLTRGAVSRWQAANGVSPTAGYFGPISRATYKILIVVIVTPTPLPQPQTTTATPATTLTTQTAVSPTPSPTPTTVTPTSQSTSPTPTPTATATTTTTQPTTSTTATTPSATPTTTTTTTPATPSTTVTPVTSVVRGWPTYRHDYGRTGATSEAGPTSGNVVWQRLWNGTTGPRPLSADSDKVYLIGPEFTTTEGGFLGYAIWAINKRSGDIAWKYNPGSGTSGSTLITIEGNTLYLPLFGTAGYKEVKAINTADGTVAATYVTPQMEHNIYPIIKDRMMYYIGDTNKIFAFDMDTRTVKWKYPLTTGEGESVVASENRPFAFADNTVYLTHVFPSATGEYTTALEGLDAATGVKTFSRPNMSLGVISGDYIYAIDWEARSGEGSVSDITVYGINRVGGSDRRNDINNTAAGGGDTLIVDDSTLYLGGKNQITAFDKATLNIAWSFTKEAAAGTLNFVEIKPVAAANGVLYAYALYGRRSAEGYSIIYAFDSATGRILWQRRSAPIDYNWRTEIPVLVSDGLLHLDIHEEKGINRQGAGTLGP